MLFWLVAVVGFILLVLVSALGWFYKLNPNIVKGASVAIMMAAVWNLTVRQAGGFAMRTGGNYPGIPVSVLKCPQP